jgi:hypothetical protein
MTDMTMMLAQLMGPTLAAVGLGFLFNSKFYEKVMKNVGKENLSVLLFPMIMVPVGIVLVMKHFMWGSLEEVLISLVGLGVLVKGVLFALMPGALRKMTKAMVTRNVMVLGGILWFLAGAYLSWYAYGAMIMA